MRAPWSRPLVAALAAVLAAALLAGCGGPEAVGPPLADLRQVASTTRDAQRASFELTVGQSLGGRELGLTATGAFDTAAGRSRTTFDLSSLAELLGGFGAALGGQRGDLGGLGDPDSWRLEAIQDGDRVYVSFPPISRRLPDGKTWIAADARDLARESGVDLGGLVSFTTSDPRSVLDSLQAVAGGLERLGAEDVRGVSTTHYRATLDADELERQLAAQGDEVVEGFRGAVARAGLASIPIDVWVGDDMLLRRLELSLELAQAGLETTTSLRMELFDYGDPVDVDLPPADRVATLRELSP